MTTHFVAYQNKDEIGAYDRKGTFFTAKQFRAETLKGQYLWVFEGSGLPKKYDLVCHGVITEITKQKRPSWYRTPKREYGTRVRFKVASTKTIAVTSFSWFKNLLKQQRSFFNGFSSIGDAAIIRSLEKLASGPSSEVIQPEAAASDIAKICNDPKIRSKTTREALISARLGMGEFRSDLQRRWGNQCAVTGCTILDILRASHIKPWSLSNNRERLDPANGILLAAHIDALFDRGLISFSNNGLMLLSERIGPKDRTMFRLPKKLRLKPTRSEQLFLSHHRKAFGF